MKLSCRTCGSNKLFEVADLGDQPIAHRLLASADEKEKRYPFRVHCCNECGLTQICEPIDPELLYRDYNYCFSSWKEEVHMASEAKAIFEHIKGGSVFEVACNDGKFLEFLKSKGASRLVGLEPNPYAGQKAKEKGFPVYPEMINEKVCGKILKDFGKFDVVAARHVLEHVVDIKNFFKCADMLLSDNGILYIDIPDCAPGLSMGDCSILWEEHASYFTEPVTRNIFLKFKFQPVVINRYNFSGITMSIIAKRITGAGQKPVSIDLGAEARVFNQQMSKYKKTIYDKLNAYRKKGYKVVLYGVGCRGCSVVNGLDLGSYIDFAIDDQLERQGKYMPGSRLPIKPPGDVKGLGDSIICLLAVNLENEEIVKKKFKDITDAKTEFVSLFSPNDIWAELANLEPDKCLKR